jgi:hypothetical protein
LFCAVRCYKVGKDYSSLAAGDKHNSQVALVVFL